MSLNRVKRGDPMTEILATFTFHGKIKAPFLQTGQEIAEFGFDRSALRNHKNQLILSGYQIQGNIKHILRGLFGVTGQQSTAGRDIEINDAGSKYTFSGEEFTRLFGLEKENGRAGMKLFDALLSRSSAPAEPVIGSGTPETRSAQDRDTGAAGDGFLITSETHFKPEEQVYFNGTGYCLVPAIADAGRLIRVLNWVARQIVLLGADKTAGHGQLLELLFETPVEKPLWAEVKVEKARAYELRLCSEQPLVLSPRERSGNILESLDFIPGDVLFGAVADWLELAGKTDTFEDVLCKIRFLHCYPEKALKAERPHPTSWAKTENASAPDGLLLRRDASRNNPVSSDGFGFVPVRAFRTRTAVNDGDLTPKNEQLYTMSALSPQGITWIGGLEWTGEVPPPDEFHELARALGSGLPRLGKTAVPVTLSLDPSQECTITTATEVTVQLLSDTWMTNVLVMQCMHKVYEAYFREHLGAAVDLIDFSALQAMRRTPRFRKTDWPLTLAGSEFKLRIDDKERTLLNRLRRTGLPAFEKTDYNVCPFIPANGYGDFLVRT